MATGVPSVSPGVSPACDADTGHMSDRPMNTSSTKRLPKAVETRQNDGSKSLAKLPEERSSNSGRSRHPMQHATTTHEPVIVRASLRQPQRKRSLAPT